MSYPANLSSLKTNLTTIIMSHSSNGFFRGKSSKLNLIFIYFSLTVLCNLTPYLFILFQFVFTFISRNYCQMLISFTFFNISICVADNKYKGFTYFVSHNQYRTGLPQKFKNKIPLLFPDFY